MRVLVCGGRHYSDQRRVDAVLDDVHERVGIGLLIHGNCPYGGADILAERWAKDREIPYLGVPAKFKREGRPAGPRRNEKMNKEFRPDLVVAFPGGDGTAGMIKIARNAGVAVTEVKA